MATNQKFTTPPGVLSWVITSGEGVDNYNKDGKVFKGTVTLAGDHMKEFMQTVKEFYEDNKSKNKDLAGLGYRHPALTDDAGEKIPQKDSDGEPVVDGKGKPMYKLDKNLVEVSFSTNTTWQDGSPKKIKIYNAKGNEVSIGNKKIGNGSKGCLVGTMSLYSRPDEEGVTFYLDGVQLIKFTEYEGDANVQSYEEEDAFEGFDEESGIEKEAAPAKDTTEAPATKTKPRL